MGFATHCALEERLKVVSEVAETGTTVKLLIIRSDSKEPHSRPTRALFHVLGHIRSLQSMKADHWE